MPKFEGVIRHPRSAIKKLRKWFYANFFYQSENPDVAIISERNKRAWEALAGKIIEAVGDSEDPIKITLIYDTEAVVIGKEAFEKFKPRKVIVEFYKKANEREINLEDVEEKIKALDELV